MFDEKTRGRIARYQSSLSPDRIQTVNAIRARLGANAPAMSDVGQAVYGSNEAIAAGPKVADAVSSGVGSLSSILQSAFEQMSGGGDSTPSPSPDALRAPRMVTKSAPFPAASRSEMPGAPGGQVARQEQDIVMDDERPGAGSKPIAPPSGKPTISAGDRASDNPTLGGGAQPAPSMQTLYHEPGSGLADMLIAQFGVPGVAPKSSSDPLAPSFSPADPSSSAPMAPVAARSAASQVNNGVMGDIQDAMNKTMLNPMSQAATALQQYLASLGRVEGAPTGPSMRELAAMNSRRAFGR